jgi:hypothetical protein
VRAAAAFLAAAACLLAGERPAIRLENGAFRVAVNPPPPESRWSELQVKAGESADAPAMAGSHSYENGDLVFRPRYPLAPGVRYRAAYGGLSAEFALPKPDLTPVTRVERVYPTTSRLPENQLKFYVHFSSPMSFGEAYRHLKLLDAGGRAIELPFLEIDEELWDREQRRLTVLFDPGRVKRGLVPHDEVGPPLEAGKRYTLVVDRNWRDAAGRRLVADYRKEFQVVEADRATPDPAGWRVTAPRAGGREALAIGFGEPLDRALMERLLHVEDAGGRRVAGTVEIDREETRWRFTPEAPWRAGEYQVVAGAWLEDLAGNRLDKVFDVDTWERVERRIAQEFRKVPFRVAP